MEEEQGRDAAQPNKLTLYGLAMVGGLGMTLMIFAVQHWRDLWRNAGCQLDAFAGPADSCGHVLAIALYRLLAGMATPFSRL